MVSLIFWSAKFARRIQFHRELYLAFRHHRHQALTVFLSSVSAPNRDPPFMVTSKASVNRPVPAYNATLHSSTSTSAGTVHQLNICNVETKQCIIWMPLKRLDEWISRATAEGGGLNPPLPTFLFWSQEGSRVESRERRISTDVAYALYRNISCARIGSAVTECKPGSVCDPRPLATTSHWAVCSDPGIHLSSPY